MAVEQNGLSGRDLRIKLFDLMKSKGIVDNVKSHLRGRLIHELRGGVGDDRIRFSSSSNPPSALVRAINALIVEFFQEQKYEYTASVFIPEAKINDYQQMSDVEILRLLNISSESTFFKKIRSQSEKQNQSSLLVSMLTCIASWLPGSSQHSGSQTSHDLWAGSIAGSTLDEKLNNLEAMYNERREDFSSAQNLSTEEKLLLFQRNIELRTQENLKQQMDQFRDNEIRKIREEERQKCQIELQSLRKELETLHKSKIESLNEKELRIGDRFKSELENERRELFLQRQAFLEELKTMKLRETENQRSLDLRERALTLEADRVKRLDEDIRRREALLTNTELRIDEQVQMKLNKLRHEIEQQFTERNKNLQLVEMKTQEEARRVNEERLHFEQAKSELSALRKHYSEADSTIHRLQSEIKVLQNENEILRDKTKQTLDYQAIRDENVLLKAQMGNRTSRSQISNRHRHDESSSSSPREAPNHSRAVVRELRQVLDNQLTGQRVVNDELIDLKTQIALLQSSNEPEPYYNGRFPSNHGGDYLSRVLKSASDAQLNQTRYSTSSNYNPFLEDARLRLLELDREAEKVEENFRDYQHRIVAKASFNPSLQASEPDHFEGRRMPSVKLGAQIQSATGNTMPASTSLQNINGPNEKFHWNKEQRLTNLSENRSSSRNEPSTRPKYVSQSNDRIFEHPEVTIKPSTADDRMQRRAMMTTLPFNSSESGGGSVPNILEHPDMKAPVVMHNHSAISSPDSSTSSSSSSNNQKNRLARQQSADVYATLARTAPNDNQNFDIFNEQKNRTNSLNHPTRAQSTASSIRDIVENAESEKNEDASSTTTSSSHRPAPINKAPVQIIRQYSETSSTSDHDAANKHSSNNNHHGHDREKAQSEDDDFW